MTAKFKPGDVVEYVNDYGVKIGLKTITELDSSIWTDPQPRYFITPTDTPWYSVKESNLKAVRQ
jgi:hypothetical protein